MSSILLQAVEAALPHRRPSLLDLVSGPQAMADEKRLRPSVVEPFLGTATGPQHKLHLERDWGGMVVGQRRAEHHLSSSWGLVGEDKTKRVLPPPSQHLWRRIPTTQYVADKDETLTYIANLVRCDASALLELNATSEVDKRHLSSKLQPGTLLRLPAGSSLPAWSTLRKPTSPQLEQFRLPAPSTSTFLTSSSSVAVQDNIIMRREDYVDGRGRDAPLRRSVSPDHLAAKAAVELGAGSSSSTMRSSSGDGRHAYNRVAVEIRRVGDTTWRRFSSQREAGLFYDINPAHVSLLLSGKASVAMSRRFEARRCIVGDAADDASSQSHRATVVSRDESSLDGDDDGSMSSQDGSFSPRGVEEGAAGDQRLTALAYYASNNETPWKIAQVLGCNVEALVAANRPNFPGLCASSRLYSNTRLIVPPGSTLPASLAYKQHRAAAPASQGGAYHHESRKRKRAAGAGAAAAAAAAAALSAQQPYHKASRSASSDMSLDGFGAAEDGGCARRTRRTRRSSPDLPASLTMKRTPEDLRAAAADVPALLDTAPFRRLDAEPTDLWERVPVEDAPAGGDEDDGNKSPPRAAAADQRKTGFLTRHQSEQAQAAARAGDSPKDIAESLGAPLGDVLAWYYLWDEDRGQVSSPQHRQPSRQAASAVGSSNVRQALFALGVGEAVVDRVLETLAHRTNATSHSEAKDELAAVIVSAVETWTKTTHATTTEASS